jgi:hypothetical protein
MSGWKLLFSFIFYFATSGLYSAGLYSTGEYPTGEYSTGEHSTGLYSTSEYSTGLYSAVAAFTYSYSTTSTYYSCSTRSH